MWAFSSWSEWGLLSSCDVQASYCCGLSCRGAWALGRMGSVVVVFILYHILIINTIICFLFVLSVLRFSFSAFFLDELSVFLYFHFISLAGLKALTLSFIIQCFL